MGIKIDTNQAIPCTIFSNTFVNPGWSFLRLSTLNLNFGSVSQSQNYIVFCYLISSIQVSKFPIFRPKHVRRSARKESRATSSQSRSWRLSTWSRALSRGGERPSGPGPRPDGESTTGDGDKCVTWTSHFTPQIALCEIFRERDSFGSFSFRIWWYESLQF